jgi:uncharacterized Fe-S cluster-containing radical SAM superfamily protein
MYDPIEMAVTTREIVCRGDRRKCYRFRPARFYGGIATADCVGCCLRCVYCWSRHVVTGPEQTGKWYSPDQVARTLVGIARRKRYRRLRISGNEPTIGREHLIDVLARIPKDFLFILETNGVLLGADPDYAEDLSRFPNLHVRVSLKGTCEEEFSRLTGAIPEGFRWQLKALENLARQKVSVHPACMTSFSPPENVSALRKRLRSIHPRLAEFEVEELILYPAVAARLEKLRIPYHTAHQPDRVPSEQV